MYVKEAEIYKIKPVAAAVQTYKYKYNGKELQEELGLNMTAMDFRQYDNAIGRFNSIDVLSELTPDWTPYRFALNNPVFWADPTGLTEETNPVNATCPTCPNTPAFKPLIDDPNNEYVYDPETKTASIVTVIEEVVIEATVKKKSPPSFSDYVGFSSGMGALYMDARWSRLMNIGKQNNFVHSNGKVYSQNYAGGRWHNALDVKASKAKFNSNIKALGRLSNGLVVVGALATIHDGATNGWENHHTADLALTATFYYVAASCGPFGWVAGGAYFVADMATQAYSGRSITENLLDDNEPIKKE
jgi:RHS repeat-associated protein